MELPTNPALGRALAARGSVLPLQAPPQGRGFSWVPLLLFPLVLLPEAPLTPDDTPVIKVTIFK